jgi:chromosome segregation ATPase
MRNRILVIGAALVAVAAVGSAQSQRGAATLDDVVSELRALRADLRQTTRATTEVQMLTVRLQLQEQRLAVLSNQRNDVSARLGVETQLRTDAERQVQGFEQSRGRNQDIGIPRAELEAAEREARGRFELHRDSEQRLRAQESQLGADIANEQNRWQDFNNRLDELERSLK